MMTVITVLVLTLVHIVWFTVGLERMPDCNTVMKLKWYKRLLVMIIYTSPIMGVWLFAFTLLEEFGKSVKFRLPESFTKWLLEE